MDENWYALYTKPRCEKKLKKALDELGIINYLPLIKQKKNGQIDIK